MTSEINEPSKEVKVKFMRKFVQYFLLSKKLEKWFPKLTIFYRCSIPSIDNCMRYSFDAIDITGICDKIKRYTRQRLQDAPSCLQITAQMNVTKKEVVDIDKKFQFLVVMFLTNY